MDAEAVARRWIELYNDVPEGTYGSDRFLELYAEDCRWREEPSVFFPEGRGSDRGTQPLRAALEESGALLSERRAELLDVVAAGDLAAMRFEWSATVEADLGPGAPPVGSRLRFIVASFMRVREGRIAELTEVLSAPIR
jgi:ketosteroid isomerase-like protein